MNRPGGCIRTISAHESCPADGTRVAAASQLRRAVAGELALFEAMILVYSLAIGFVAAGLSFSIFQLVTQEPARFVVPGKSIPVIIITGFFFAVTGPMMI